MASFILTFKVPLTLSVDMGNGTVDGKEEGHGQGQSRAGEQRNVASRKPGEIKRE